MSSLPAYNNNLDPSGSATFQKKSLMINSYTRNGVTTNLFLNDKFILANGQVSVISKSQNIEICFFFFLFVSEQ